MDKKDKKFLKGETIFYEAEFAGASSIVPYLVLLMIVGAFVWLLMPLKLIKPIFAILAAIIVVLIVNAIKQAEKKKESFLYITTQRIYGRTLKNEDINIQLESVSLFSYKLMSSVKSLEIGNIELTIKTSGKKCIKNVKNPKQFFDALQTLSQLTDGQPE